MAVQLPAWAKDRRVQLAAGGGAVLGLVVLIRRGSTDQSAAGDAASSSGAQSGQGVLGSYDSTATDAYNNLEGALEAQGAQITSLSDQLRELLTAPSSGGGSTGGNQSGPPVTPRPKPTTPKRPPGVVRPKEPPTKKPAGKTRTITIRRGDSLSQLARQYHTTVGRLMALNPTVHNANRIRAGAKLRVPA